MLACAWGKGKLSDGLWTQVLGTALPYIHGPREEGVIGVPSTLEKSRVSTWSERLETCVDLV